MSTRDPGRGGAATTLAVMDKFRGTASARELVDALAQRVADLEGVAASDGGEGFRGAFDGDVERVRVRGPWGEWHEAPLTRLAGTSAGVLEVAEIVGRDLRGPVTSSRALAASSAGVADALRGCARLGLTHVTLGCGGSATSDGGAGLLEAVRDEGLPLAVTCATDITAPYVGALRYAVQKGVDPSDLDVVERRLQETARELSRLAGRDVAEVAGSGAAGGIAGALVALGAEVTSGFSCVAEVTHLPARIAAARQVITGEGRLDEGSLEGKVVGHVCELTSPHQRVLVVCGEADPTVSAQLTERFPWVRVVDLVSTVGRPRALSETVAAVVETVEDFLAAR